MTLAIETHGLTKTFGTTHALAGIDLQIEKGTVYGLLGPNGAGKTTAIRILTTLAKPTSGTATVLGHDVVKDAKWVRQQTSLTGQAASVDDELTGIENLVMVGRLLGFSWREAKTRAAELLGAFGLDDAGRRLVRTYSGGMRRRIDIAASLVSTPEILFLDEPTTGLDPRSRNQVWDIVRRIAADGTTVVLTTQYLEEADRLADRMAVIDHGRVIAEGTSAELKALVGANALHIRLADRSQRPQAEAIVTAILGDGLLPGTDPAVLSATVSDASKASQVIDGLSLDGIEVLEFSLGNPSLDDVFFAITGKPAETAREVTA